MADFSQLNNYYIKINAKYINKLMKIIRKNEIQQTVPRGHF